MADYDNSPALWGNAFGTLKIGGDHGEGSYRITALDIILLGTMTRYEEYYPYLALWALAQRFAGYKQNRRGGLDYVEENGLSSFIQYFSAPVNPAFAFSGRPRPDRAVGRCPDGIQGRGRLPSAHPRGVPVRPSQGTWNTVMCTSGARPSHGNDGESTKAARRQRFQTIRHAMWGGSDEEKNSAWRSLTSANVRLAVWNFIFARAGNPIPGFDNWAACWAYGRGGAKGRRIIIPNLAVAEQERALSRIREMSHSELRNPSTYVPVRFGAAMSSNQREGFGQVSRSNCFLYHTYMNNGDEVWVEFDNGSRLYDSRRAQIDMSHTEGSNVERITTAAATTSGGVAPTNDVGLAPTEQRPASAPDSRTNTPSELGREEDLFRQLEQWAINMEQSLTNEFGSGTRR